MRLSLSNLFSVSCSFWVATALASTPQSWQGLQSLQQIPVKVEAPLIMTFFQLECPSCDHQLKELDCFSKLGFSSLAVGVGASRLEVLRKLRRHSQSAAAFRMDLSQARHYGLNVSPVSFVKNSQDEGGFWVLGHVPCPEHEDTKAKS